MQQTPTQPESSADWLKTKLGFLIQGELHPNKWHEYLPNITPSSGKAFVLYLDKLYDEEKAHRLIELITDTDFYPHPTQAEWVRIYQNNSLLCGVLHLDN